MISKDKRIVIVISHNMMLASGHYGDVIMGAMASQITCPMIVYSAFYSGADQRKHHSSAPLAFVRGIHRWQVNSPYKGPVTRRVFPFDDVIMRNFAITRLYTAIIEQLTYFVALPKQAI